MSRGTAGATRYARLCEAHQSFTEYCNRRRPRLLLAPCMVVMEDRVGLVLLGQQAPKRQLPLLSIPGMLGIILLLCSVS